MGNYRYFTDDEVKGLQGNGPAMLDMARGLATKALQEATGNPNAEVPFRLTATVATDGHSSNSAHYKGLAVDIGLGHLAEGAERDMQRWAILVGLCAAGFKRIEICQLHIHADWGQPPDYASPLCWMGEDL